MSAAGGCGRGQKRMRWGGVAMVARVTGMAISTVHKGRDEVRKGARREDVVKVRRAGGGRRAHDVVFPEL